MNPLQFEQAHGAEWDELERLLSRADRSQGSWRGPPPTAASADAARLARLYRRCCEHLAIAEARAYPPQLARRLRDLAWRAHRIIYLHRSVGLGAFIDLVRNEIPRSARRLGAYVAVAAALLLVPTLLLGWWCWRNPSFALHVLDAEKLAQFRAMYGDGTNAIGRTAGADWSMFGFYIFNNISIAFQCFAGGILGGLGTVMYLLFNGLYGGATAGYLTFLGMGHNFYPFVVTHSAFELTAIVLSGAAGLRVGVGVIAPGRLPRAEALRTCAQEVVPLLYGVVGMLVVAAMLEAFWSSARWVAPIAKYGAGAFAWLLVLGWLGWSGRPAPGPRPVRRPWGRR